MEKKVVLLLGSTGMIGNAIREKLRGMCKLIEYNRKSNVFHMAEVALSHNEWQREVTHVINAAGLNKGSPEEMIVANVDFPERMARTIASFNREFVFIQIGSYGVYNGSTSLLDLGNKKPLNSYEKTKSDVIERLSFLEKRLIVIHPTNVVIMDSKKTRLRYLFWPIKSRILLTHVEDLANVCISLMAGESKFSESLVVSRQVESGFISLYGLKQSIHRILIRLNSQLIPYYLFYFEYRKR